MAKPSTKGPAQRIVTPQTTPRVGPIRFVQEIIAELRKAVWPTRQETTRLTYLVILVSLAVGAILALLDFAFSRGFTFFLVWGGP